MKPEKLDLFAEHKTEYKAAKKPALVKTSPAQYLAVDGIGPPGSEAFEACIGALYSMAFTIKMTRKFAGQGDYAVCKLETLWQMPSESPRDRWRWTLMIRTPDFIGPEDLKKALGALRSKGKAQKVEKVTLKKLAEGACAQMLHVGPYEQLGESYIMLEAFAAEKELKRSGCPHDIYLSDPRRVAPEKLKTIIRLPVR